MQGLPAEPGQLLLSWQASEFLMRAAIGRIAQQGVPYSGHVDTDLMRSAGAGAELNQGVGPKALQHAKLGECLAPKPRLCGHLLSIHRMPADCRVDDPR